MPVTQQSYQVSQARQSCNTQMYAELLVLWYSFILNPAATRTPVIMDEIVPCMLHWGHKSMRYYDAALSQILQQYIVRWHRVHRTFHTTRYSFRNNGNVSIGFIVTKYYIQSSRPALVTQLFFDKEDLVLDTQYAGPLWSTDLPS